MKRYKHLVEIGAGDAEISEGLSWTTHAERVTLVEPNPIFAASLREAAAGLNNVQVREEEITAVFSPLVLLGYASYLAHNPSFFATSIEPEAHYFMEPLKHEAFCVKPDLFDQGDIDYLILTPNGGEFEILSGLTSRPSIIRTKHYLHNGIQHDVARGVFAWMHHNRYVPVELSSNQHRTFLSLEWRRQ